MSEVAVGLQGFTHRSPSDVALLMVGPQRRRALLMAEVGGQDSRYSSLTNLTLVLDEDATNPLPVFDRVVSGSFQPTDDYWPDPYFADPGGVLPYSTFRRRRGVPILVPHSLCSKILPPNGTWNLFALDDSPIYSGYISNGWSLYLDVAAPL